MSLKDAAGTIIIVLAIVGMFIALSGQIGDLGERIARIEAVIDERLPRSPIPAAVPM